MVNVGPSDSNPHKDPDSNPGKGNIPSDAQSLVVPKDSFRILRQYFAGVVEYAFMYRMGVVDPPLTDYITGLLTGFTRADQILSFRTPNGKRLNTLTDMQVEAMARKGDAQAEAYRKIADIALFCTGYEYILPREGTKDALINPRDVGKASYLKASRLNHPNVDPAVLEGLSDQFDLCVYGLSEVKRQLKDDRNGGPLTIL